MEIFYPKYSTNRYQEVETADLIPEIERERREKGQPARQSLALQALAGGGLRDEGRDIVKFTKLHKAVRKVLIEAINAGGSTMGDGLYQHVGGESGDYWLRRRVYDREGELCLRCKTPVKKGVIGQRSTYWCPNCQAV